MQKDFDLIMEAAHELKTPLFTNTVTHQVYTAANVAGYGDLDYASVSYSSLRIRTPWTSRMANLGI